MLLVEGPANPIHAMLFSPDSHHLFTGSQDGMIRCWGGGGDLVEEFGSQEASPRHCLAFSDDGSRLFFNSGQQLEEWGTERRAWHPMVKDAPDAVILSMQLLGRNLLALGTGHPSLARSGHFLLWDLAKGMPLLPTFREPNGVRGVAVHAASKTVAWITAGRLWSLWTTTKPDRKERTLKHTSSVNNSARSIAFHPDGEQLAIGVNWDVQLHGVNAVREPGVLKGHKGVVSTLAYSPDGRTLATGSWDSTVRLWELSTGREQACFRWPIGRVNCLAYAPDGLRLAAAGATGQIVIWDCD